jgi:hypothetical protein
MSGRSSIDSLSRLAPVSDSDAAAFFGADGREGLLADLTQLPYGRGATRRPAGRRRRRLVLAVAIVALAAIATAATWVVLDTGPARETTSVQCLIGGNDAIIPATTGDPAQDCAADYKREFGTAAPALVAYDNGRGGVTVIPRSHKPEAGWKRLVSGQDVDLIQLQDSLDDYVNGLNSRCLDTAAATALAKAKLAEFGFTGWTVGVRNRGSCTNGDYVDPASETVTLIAGDVTTGHETAVRKLADRLRPVTRECQSLPGAVASVRSAAEGLTYNLNAVQDNSLRCAAIYETVGGTIFLTVRGPSH